MEIAGEQMNAPESRKNYFKFIEDIKKIKNDKYIKNSFFYLLSKLKKDFTSSEGFVDIDTMVFNFYDYNSNFNFLKAINVAIPYVSDLEKDIEQTNRVYKDKYNEEDIKNFLENADNPHFENCKKMPDIIIKEIK